MDGEIERLARSEDSPRQAVPEHHGIGPRASTSEFGETQKLKAKLVANVKALVSQQVETCERRCRGYLP